MSATPEILHYTGGDNDRGGVISVVRNLAASKRFRCVLGVNPGCAQSRQPALPVLELPRIDGEKINPATLWRARAVARAVQAWLHTDARRVFHGHSRAGMLVGLWLARWGEPRVVVSVHCYGRQRWFYRWAAQQLGGRLYWLSPAMKRYYGLGDDTWTQCVPGCLPPGAPAVPAARRAPADGTIRLAGIGALVRWKRWDLVLAALALLPGGIRGRFSFRQIGTDDGTSASRAYADEMRASGALVAPAVVEWRGQQASSAGLLAESDCLVIASHQEPFSIAMLEAVQAGVPVLAADSGGAADIVQPGANGWLFRSGDAAALAEKLTALGDPATWARLAPETVDLKRFGADEVSAEWLGIYQGRLLS